MQPLKYWSLPAKIAAVAGSALLVLLGVLIGEFVAEDGFAEGLRRAAPIAGSVVALAALATTAVGLLGNWNRQRREATFAAWVAWSDSTKASRQLHTRLLGPEALTEQQGRALARKEAIDGFPFAPQTDDYAIFGNGVVDLLNGLERMAVGVHLGFYDSATFRALGGTIIVRQYERFETYITARNSAVADDQQKRAYTNLPELVAEFTRHSLLAEAKELDDSRLKRMRRGLG